MKVKSYFSRLFLFMALCVPWVTHAQQTTPSPASIPYSCGFEDTQENSNWQYVDGSGANVFTVGTATSGVYAGSQGMYVTNNRTSGSHTYNSSSSTMAFAYRTLHFDSKGYQVNLKFKATGGEAGYDFGRIILCSTSVSLTGGTGSSLSSFTAPTSVAEFDDEYRASATAKIQLNIATKTLGTVDANGWHTISYFLDMTNRPGDYNLVLIWNNDASAGTANYPLAVDNISIEELSCIPPSTVALDSLVSDRFKLNFSQNDVSQWEVVVNNASFTKDNVPATATYRQIVNNSYAWVSGLTANTQYWYSVRAICGANDTSNWKAVSSINTACAAVSLPMTEGFENANSINCWMNTGTSGSVTRNTAYKHYGSASMKIVGANVASPELNVTTLAPDMLNGWCHSTTDSATFAVGIMTDPNDASTFEPLTTVTIPTRNTWTEFTSYFTLLNDPDYADFSNARYIVISVPTGSTVYFDDLLVDVTPTCPKPTEVSITNIGAHQFDISFTNNAPGCTSWEVTTNGTPHVITTNPATITGLSAASTYSVQIAAICSATDTSYYTTVGNIKTTCDVVNAPFTENFENQTTNSIPDCWDNSASTTSTATSTPYYVWGVYNYNNNNMLRMYNYLVRSGHTEILTPQIGLPAGNGYEFKYDISPRANSGNTYVYVQVFGGTAGFVCVDTIPQSGSTNSTDPGTFSTRSIDLSAYAGDTITIKFENQANYGSGSIFLDNISIKALLNCSDPNTPTVSNVTAATATVQFTDTCSAHNSWQYVYGQTGFDPSTATPQTLDSMSFTLTGLTSDADYTVYVRANCGSVDGFSNWIQANFHTLCTPFHVTSATPFNEDFSDFSNGAYINTEGVCYNVLGEYQSNTSYWAKIYPTVDPSTSTSIYKYCYGHSTDNTDKCLYWYMYRTYAPNGGTILRQFHLDADSVYELSAWGRSYQSTFYTTKFSVLMGTSTTALDTLTSKTVNGASVSSQYDGTNYWCYYNTLYEQIKTVVSVDSTGDYYIGFNMMNPNTSSSYCYAYLDDWTMRAFSGCAPKVATVSAITDSSAHVTMSGSAHHFEYVLNDTTQAATSVNDTEFDITGLNSASAYTLFVRTYCDSASYSEWMTVQFTTACGIIRTFPYTQDFEGYTANSSPICWDNSASTSTSYSGAVWGVYSYSSNKMLHMWNYNTESGNAVIETPTFALPAQPVELAFDYTNNVESNDFLVKISTNGGASYTTIGTYPTSDVDGNSYEYGDDPGTFTHAVIDLTNYVGQNVKFQLYNLATYGYGAVFFDNMTITYIPACREPQSAPTITGTTMTTLSAQASMATKDTIEFGIAPYSSTVTSASITDTVLSTDGNCTFTGLTGSTTYAVWYRYHCDSNEVSDWSLAYATGTTMSTDCFDPQNLRTVGIVSDHHAAFTWGVAPDVTTYSYELYLGDTATGSAIVSATTTQKPDTIDFSTLNGNTDYYFRVQGTCGGTTTDWVGLPIHTTYPIFAMPFVCNFEDSTQNNGWKFNNINSGLNELFIGSDANNGGTQALYVSDDASTHNYTITSTSNSDAEVLLEIPAGNYFVQYDWKGVGESGYDYGRVFLVPSSTTISTISTSLPSGGIALDNGSKLNQQNSWTSVSKIVSVPTDGVYKLVVAWHNDASVGTQPPLAIDNIRITTFCYDTIHENICQGQTYSWHGHDLTETSVINDTVPTTTACDTVYTLSLQVNPVYTQTDTVEQCERDVYTWYDGQHSLTTAGEYTDTLPTAIYGCDSIFNLTLTVHAAPEAEIWAGGAAVTNISNHCDLADLALTARSTINGSTFAWEDASTATVRTVQPHGTNTYTLVATEPAYGCTSLPAKVTVTTTAAPDPVITAVATTLCAGESTTLTVSDNNGLNNKYRWSTGDTTATITVTPNTTTNYIVTVTTDNASACEASAQQSIKVNALPSVSIVSSDMSLCRQESLTLTANPMALDASGYQYNWTDLGMTGPTVSFVATETRAYNLTVNDATTGCSNNFTSDPITVYPAYVINDTMSACEAMLPIHWGNKSLQNEGNTTQTWHIDHGCDSTVHLYLKVTPTGVINSNMEVCYGTRFSFGEGTYAQPYVANASGIISYVDTTSQVCPVQYNLNLTVNPTAESSFSATSCDQYFWNGLRTESGAYNYTYKTTKNCDSVVTLNLTILNSTEGVDEQSPCDKLVWIDGNTYTEDNNTAQTTIRNAAGCDSLVTLHLTLRHQSQGIDSVSTCEKSYTWINGATYRTNIHDGSVAYKLPTVQNRQGCDSTLLLQLTLTPALDTLNWADLTGCDILYIDTMACDGTIGEKQITTAGDYILPVASSTPGRYNIGRYHVTMNYSDYKTIAKTACVPYNWYYDADEDTLIANITEEMVGDDSLFIFSKDLSEIGITAANCSNILVLRLTTMLPTRDTTTQAICNGNLWQGKSYAESGIYAYDTIEAQGSVCDNYKYVNLTVNPSYKNVPMSLSLCESQFVDNFYTLVDPNHAGKSVNLPKPVLTADTTIEVAWNTTLGCDSSVSLSYHVYPITNGTFTKMACHEYTWPLNGKTYTASNSTDTVVLRGASVHECDSVVTLNLTVSDSVINHFDTVVCESYTFRGATYRVDNTFREVRTSSVEGSCDSVDYFTFHVDTVDQIHQYIVSNRPYTWRNGVTYNADAEGIYYDTPAPAGCDSVLVLHFTLADSIAICQSVESYEWNDESNPFSNVIIINAQAPIDSVYEEFNAMGSGVKLYYSVYPSYDLTQDTTVCDKFVWGDDTYTTSQSITKTFSIAQGCDSVQTYNLTVNYMTFDTVSMVYCDSIQHLGIMFYQDTVFDTLFTKGNAKQCDSTHTLVLTINKNYDVEQSETACDSYTWNTTGITYDSTGRYTKAFQDVNGCWADSVLNLTVNYKVYNAFDSIVNGASTVYRGILYHAPTDTVINDTVLGGVATTGCDSINQVHLRVNAGTIVAVDTVSCGDYTWMDGSVYTWVPASRRINPAINYAKRSGDNLIPVVEFPMYYTYFTQGADSGIVDKIYVLNLTMAEARVEYKEVNFLLSNDTYTDTDDVTAHVFDFSAYKAAMQDTTVLDTLRYGSDQLHTYCDSIVYYTFNLKYNYDTLAPVTKCFEDTVYIAESGASFLLTQGANSINDTTGRGTINEMVHNVMVTRSALITGSQTTAVCDTFTWNGNLYNITGVYMDTLSADNGCDSVVTLTLTVTNTVHYVVDTAVCDSINWHGANYSANGIYTWSRLNVADTQCVDVDTLHLVVNHSNTGIDTQVACDSLTWIDGHVYNASTTTPSWTLTNANVYGCDSTVTLHLTVNHSVTNPDTVFIDTIAPSYTLTDRNGEYSFLAPGQYDTTLTYNTVNQCDSLVNYHLNIHNYVITAENPIECGYYIWNRNGHNYEWISNEEKNANKIGGILAPLYKDVTTNEYIYQNPMDTVGYDVHLLNLTLNEVEFVDSTVPRFPQSMGIFNGVASNYDFSGLTSVAHPTFDTTVYETVAHATLCGTVVRYHVHVVYDTTSDDTTICYATTYTWEDSTTSAVVVGSENVITKMLFVGDMARQNVVTRTITVRPNNNLAEVSENVCDSIIWNGSVYNTSNDYTFSTADQYGCDSITTLHLTVNYTATASETLVKCDSVQWNDTWYYQSGVYTHTALAAAANGCDSITTLNLTINAATDTTVDVCDSFTWTVTGLSYTTSGNYESYNQISDECYAHSKLFLTVRKSSVSDTVMYVTDGSYHYVAGDNSGVDSLILAGRTASFTEHYTNAAGCDSTRNITINVGTAFFLNEEVTVCGRYTWRDGNTYVWISPEERAEHNALYLNETSGEYVTSYPIHRVTFPDNYDSVYLLTLSLTQDYTEAVTVNFPISKKQLVYSDSTFQFVPATATDDSLRNFIPTSVSREVHFGSELYCDSIHYLTVNLQNNYELDTVMDICVTQSSINWMDSAWDVSTSDLDNLHTYYFYKHMGTAEAPVVKYVKVLQHPVVYATERRTACDSYTWNGHTYTESTSNATYTTANQYGCDSTVTLNLTVKYSTQRTDNVKACNIYRWTEGDDITYMVDTIVTKTGMINSVGCDSTYKLNLTVKPNVTETVTACDSYTWHGHVYDTTGVYTDSTGFHTIDNCDSIVTLNLTVNYNTSTAYVDTACDSYTWVNAHDTGMVSTYNTSGTYFYNYNTVAGCASVDTLRLVVNHNTNTAYDTTVCDSYDWNDSVYTTSGTYFYNYNTVAGCASTDTLHLTVNYGTHNSESAVACQTYTWHGQQFNFSSPIGATKDTVALYNYNNVDLCPSVDTLYLTLGGGRTFFTDTVENCGPYTWIVNDSVIGTFDLSINTSTSFNNPRTGCDSMVFLRLTVNEAPVTDSYFSVCDNKLPYLWNGLELNVSCDTNVHFHFSDKCDSIANLHLTVNETQATTINDQVCLGKGYHGYGFNIPSADLHNPGVYTFPDSLMTVNGCDSIVTLNLTVGSILTSTDVVTSCESYIWAKDDQPGRKFVESGVFTTMPYEGVEGCLHVDSLYLTINPAYNDTLNVTACDSYTWDANGVTYTASTSDVTELTSVSGCDSVLTLNLTVNYNTNTGLTSTACDNYEWNGQTYTTSGLYTYDYNTAEGCASTDTLHLTILNSTHDVLFDTACDSYDWTDVISHQFAGTFTESGIYTFDYYNVDGCYSTDTLHLTIKNSVTSEFNAAVCFGESYVWNGQTYATSGDYQQTFSAANGCDSIVTLHLIVGAQVISNIADTSCGAYTWNGATYANSGVYTQLFTAATGCDSIVNLTLTVNNTSSSSTNEIACGSYEWNDQVYTQSGVYTFTTTGANGCDSVATLILTVYNATNAAFTATACDSYNWHDSVYTTSGTYLYNYNTAAGCTSTDTLYLTINNTTSSTSNEMACGSYSWNGQTYSVSGTYVAHLTNANGCDSTATLNLTVNQPTTETVNQTVCDNYLWYGQNYTTSGVYTHYGFNEQGCSHTATLNLTVNHSTTGVDEQTACDSYNWINGQTYTASTNSPTVQIRNAAGCDSTVTLHLTINNSTAASENATSCTSFTWNGQTYNNSGVYSYTTTGANGCDSVTTLTLLINSAATTFGAVTACDSYNWNGTTYNTTGIYTQSFTAANDCDSIVTLSITINPSTFNNDTITACNTYTWIDDSTYTLSGTYYLAAINAYGCNHLNTLVLTVNYGDTNVATEASCDSYVWQGDSLTNSGVFTRIFTNQQGCDSVEILNLTINNSFAQVSLAEACDSYTWEVNGETYTESGAYVLDYTTVAGCDSIYTLNLSINYSTVANDTVVLSTSDWPYNYSGYVFEDFGDYVINITNAAGCDSTIYLNLQHNVGIDDVNLIEVRTYPNPTTGKVTITAENVIKVEVIDFVGRKVAEFENTNTIDLTEFASGSYALRITLPEGTTIRKVVKR